MLQWSFLTSLFLLLLSHTSPSPSYVCQHRCKLIALCSCFLNPTQKRWDAKDTVTLSVTCGKFYQCSLFIHVDSISSPKFFHLHLKHSLWQALPVTDSLCFCLSCNVLISVLFWRTVFLIFFFHVNTQSVIPLPSASTVSDEKSVFNFVENFW